MSSIWNGPFAAMLEERHLTSDRAVVIVSVVEARQLALDVFYQLLAAGFTDVQIYYLDSAIISLQMEFYLPGPRPYYSDLYLLYQCHGRECTFVYIGNARIRHGGKNLQFYEDYLANLTLAELPISAADVIYLAWSDYAVCSGFDLHTALGNAIVIQETRGYRIQQYNLLSFNSKSVSFKARLENTEQLVITGMIYVPECYICGICFSDFYCGFKDGIIDSFGAANDSQLLKDIFEVFPDLKRVSKLYLADEKTAMLYNETIDGTRFQPPKAVLRFGIDNPVLPLLSFVVQFGSRDLDVYGERKDGRRHVLFKNGQYFE